MDEELLRVRVQALTLRSKIGNKHKQKVYRLFSPDKRNNKLFIRRILDYIGQYFVRISGCDMLIFSAGIGENSPYYRKKICEALKPTMGTEIDLKANNNTQGKTTIISTKNSKVKIAMIPTDEEVVIARDAYKIYKK